jgi:hypothetical protein
MENLIEVKVEGKGVFTPPSEEESSLLEKDQSEPETHHGQHPL